MAQSRPRYKYTKRCLTFLSINKQRFFCKKKYKSSNDCDDSMIILNVQIGHHFAEIRQSVIIGIRIDVREILIGVGLDEARIISA